MSQGRRRWQQGAIGLIFRDRRRRPRGRPGGSDHPDGRRCWPLDEGTPPRDNGGGRTAGVTARRRSSSGEEDRTMPDFPVAELSKMGRRCRATPYFDGDRQSPPPRAGQRSRLAGTMTTNTNRLSITIIPTVAHGPITTRGSTIIVEIAIVDYRVAIG